MLFEHWISKMEESTSFLCKKVQSPIVFFPIQKLLKRTYLSNAILAIQEVVLNKAEVGY